MASHLLYLDQNYLSGIVKGKPAFRELEPVLRKAVARGAVAVPESMSHRLESAARPDLSLLELLRELSGGLRLPDRRGAIERACERRLAVVLERNFPERRGRASDATSSGGVASTCASAPSCSPAVAPTSYGCVSASSGCESACRMETDYSPRHTAVVWVAPWRMH